LDPRLVELVEAADLNELLRAVDGLCASRSWDDLVDLAELCEEAVERGKQLWPIAQHIDYRIALEGPGDYAASVLHPEVGRFAAGPLTEVAASTHDWASLAPHVESPQVAAYVAQERVLRGERLTDDGRAHAHAEVLELPLELCDFEPTYALATFAPHHVEVAEPWDARAPLEESVATAGERLDEPELISSLLDLVQPWTSESNGAADAVVVEGGAEQAIAALSFGSVRTGPLRVDEALQRMAWAAASGGAHGRRRGAALGRFMAWYTTALLADVSWPAAPEDLGAAARSLRWLRWEEDDIASGWILRLAIEDPDNGWAAAIAASDYLEEEDEASEE
jgi:hypothetical protein